jgi:hypothetical protein
MAEHLTDYRPTLRRLIEQLLDVARDNWTHQPRAGEKRYRMSNLLPAARRLIDAETSQTDDYPSPPADDLDVKFEDGHGHTRPAYRHLAIRIYQLARGSPQPIQLSDTNEDFSSQLWQTLLKATAKNLSLEAVRSAITQAVDLDADGPLHPQSVDEAMDHWTYRELVGLQALQGLATALASSEIQGRVTAAAAYHLAHTQPDYTTYQPWGLSAFLSSTPTVSLADQQIHDLTTQVHINSPASAIIASLILADCLSHRIIAA